MTPSKPSRWLGWLPVLIYSFTLTVESRFTERFHVLSQGWTNFSVIWCITSSLFFFVWDFIQPKSKSLPSRIGFVTLCSLLALITFFVMDYLQSPPIADHKLVVYLGAVFITLVMFILPSFLLGLLVVVLGWVIRKWFIKSPSEGSPLKP